MAITVSRAINALKSSMSSTQACGGNPRSFLESITSDYNRGLSRTSPPRILGHKICQRLHPVAY